MKRTVTRLADGRELIYFDRRDDAVRDAVDTRPPDGPPAASELRHDPLLDEWVTIAAHRQRRTFLPGDDACPLCPSAPGRPTEIPAADYEVAVLENRFPAFRPEATGGRCEVVCFSSDHRVSFADLPPAQVRTVVEAWADRTAELSATPGVEQVFCFENRGEEIGVTLHHPHGQIYAYPFVPPRTRQMLRAVRRHAERTGGDLFAELLAAERREGARVVVANELWTAFVPHAARWPFEVHLYPHRRVPDIPALDEAERDAFARLYLDVLDRFDRLFDRPAPYVSAWHQAPVREGRDLAWLHLRLFSIRRAADRLKYLAGSEAAMGAFLNDVRPEEAARLLRAAGR
ncbi:UDPglucose--hexose-1-phosphate uridylyltransferase [Thermomonospora echinospora]|uniref:Galactose-1-phosphate uridylyltransferase n=1 Tax=Thermomonospora echinospora TaxID=1992 RepID=A0A1H6BDS0_9ACTN|nr:galactose-1-phosphate uridylyltransferase [Thermomonospora echinospora]SEG58961.1 UDPglucose--hexose-1-phosphate uridylyltransferase [Thermomonospora echinospora]